jgi:hypothetical protein
LKAPPAEYRRLVLEMNGYISRELYPRHLDKQPGWHEFNSGLARATEVSGQVLDDAGKPLQDVRVRLDNVVAADGSWYQQADENAYECLTSSTGHFRMASVPRGACSVWISKKGYCYHGLGPKIQTPKSALVLTMNASAQLVISVDFGQMPRPAAYIVELEPEGGNKIGTWGGSGNIDANKQMSFNDVPPGRYFVCGHPNPSSEKERTKLQLVELKGGEKFELTLPANLPRPAPKPMPPRTLKNDDAF